MNKIKSDAGVVTGDYRDKLSFNLAIVNYRDGKETVIFCPALDLCAVGSDLKVAEKEFKELMALYLEETEEFGTLKNDLERLGWQFEPTKISPPKITKLISSNPLFRKVLSSSSYTSRHKQVYLPAIFNGNNNPQYSSVGV